LLKIASIVKMKFKLI